MATRESIVNSRRNGYDGDRSESEGAMKSDDDWVNLVKGILRAEMARRGMTYEQLAAKLAEVGVQDTAVNIRNKVARGGFSAVFFVQCLRAIGCKQIQFD
jgi:ribosome-binding protein aMBF1 (putative translation factor)